MNCRDARSVIGGGDLAIPFPSEVETHLGDCARCRRYAAEMRANEARLVRLSRTPVDAPEMSGVLFRLHAVLSGTTANGTRPSTLPPQRQFRRRGKGTDMQTERTAVAVGMAREPRRSPRRWATGMALAILLGTGAGLWVTQQKLHPHSAAGGGDAAWQQKARYAAAREVSLNNLKQMSIGFHMFAEAHGDTTPPMDDSEAAKQAIRTYTDNSRDIFSDPVEGIPYRTNPYAGNKKLNTFMEAWEKLVIFYEGQPDAEGKWRVAFLDGHVAILTQKEWDEAKQLSHIP